MITEIGSGILYESSMDELVNVVQPRPRASIIFLYVVSQLRLVATKYPCNAQAMMLVEEVIVADPGAKL